MITASWPVIQLPLVFRQTDLRMNYGVIQHNSASVLDQMDSKSLESRLLLGSYSCPPSPQHECIETTVDDGCDKQINRAESALDHGCRVDRCAKLGLVGMTRPLTPVPTLRHSMALSGGLKRDLMQSDNSDGKSTTEESSSGFCWSSEEDDEFDCHAPVMSAVTIEIDNSVMRKHRQRFLLDELTRVDSHEGFIDGLDLLPGTDDQANKHPKDLSRCSSAGTTASMVSRIPTLSRSEVSVMDVTSADFPDNDNDETVIYLSRPRMSSSASASLSRPPSNRTSVCAGSRRGSRAAEHLTDSLRKLNIDPSEIQQTRLRHRSNSLSLIDENPRSNNTLSVNPVRSSMARRNRLPRLMITPPSFHLSNTLIDRRSLSAYVGGSCTNTPFNSPITPSRSPLPRSRSRAFTHPNIHAALDPESSSSHASTATTTPGQMLFHPGHRRTRSRRSLHFHPLVRQEVQLLSTGPNPTAASVSFASCTPSKHVVFASPFKSTIDMTRSSGGLGSHASSQNRSPSPVPIYIPEYGDYQAATLPGGKKKRGNLLNKMRKWLT